jgi:aldehyde dehydrogenase (NAD+)
MESRLNFVHGEWRASSSDAAIDVVNPATEAVIASVPVGSTEDADEAVAAARAALAGWSALSVAERAAHLDSVHGELEKIEDDLVQAVVTDVGMPSKIARRLQIGLPLAILASYADASMFPEQQFIGHSLVVREPVGVVAAITPWNYPLHQSVAKLAPALLAGCTLVLKPSEVTPLCIYLLAEAVERAGVPAGVFNLISGLGTTVGEALVRHPDVDMVSFTGSTRAGARIAAAAAETIKRTALELGGKGANVVLPDVGDLSAIVRSGVGNCYLNSGQTCLALTRMLVHRSHYAEAIEIAKETASRFSLGDPFNPTTKLGPLTSQAHLERVRNYIELGVEEGAELVIGGSTKPDGIDKGYFVRPTIFADVTPDMTIAREEIFGPVLCMMPFESDDEAIEIANGTEYGLTAAVWSGDSDRALSVATRIRAGQVDVNGAAFNPKAPFGGYGKSGIGRELGVFGIEEFLEVKSIQL